MSTYQRCDPDTVKLIKRVLRDYHGELATEKVTFDALFAYGPVDDSTGEKKGPAISSRGYPAIGKVKATPLKERAKGAGDFELIFDGDQWPDWSDDQRVALIDHELTHLSLPRDREGMVKRDDLMRPKFIIRPHDHEIGFFEAVAHRHGELAFEVHSFRVLGETLRQLKLPFAG